MSKAYVLIFNTHYATQEKLTQVLNVCSTVITWRFDMTNAIYIISNNTAFQISAEIEKHIGQNSGRYMVLEYTGNSQGRLTGESWYLLNNKHHKPKA